MFRLATYVAGAMALALLPAAAQVREVLHTDIEKDGAEVEFMNGLTLSDVQPGDEQSAHELAFSYAPFDWWKPIVALEIANPRGANAEVEAFEFGNVFLLTGGGHDHHDHAGGDHSGGDLHSALALFAGFELPNAAGLNEAALEFGPLLELSAGPWLGIGNLLVDIPLEDGVDPGLGYALSVSYAVSRKVRLGMEAYGTMDELFGSSAGFARQEHSIGPAAYFSFDLGYGRILEPRVALLSGYTGAGPDMMLSLNVELKF